MRVLEPECTMRGSAAFDIQTLDCTKRISIVCMSVPITFVQLRFVLYQDNTQHL